MNNPKWIRGTVGGRTVVDSRAVRLVWENPYFPAWYFPIDDIDAEFHETDKVIESPTRGVAQCYDLVVGSVRLTDAAWRFTNSDHDELRDLVRIEWSSFDAWFEEEEEVFVHPRSPEARIDALPSSREVRVTLDGVELAHSNRPTLLFETGLPVRYYLPKSDVRLELLTPNTTESACPYKGWARYWNVLVNGTSHPDLAWSYKTTLPESRPIAGLVCFYNEHVDIEVDGVHQQRPTTPFTDDKFA